MHATVVIQYVARETIPTSQKLCSVKFFASSLNYAYRSRSPPDCRHSTLPRCPVDMYIDSGFGVSRMGKTPNLIRVSSRAPVFLRGGHDPSSSGEISGRVAT